MMNRWFTKYLHGIDNGVEKEPRSRIVRESSKRLEPTSYADYPHPEAQIVSLHPTKGGINRGGLSTDAIGTQVLETLVDDSSKLGASLAKAESSKHRLLFETPELKEPLHLSGYAKMKIRLSSSKPTANLSIWLVSLPWTEDSKTKFTDNLITRGWADPQNSRSLRESSPLVPGEFVELSFMLQPDDQVIAAGERIGLMIFSSDPEFTLLPEPGTELTVDLQKTQLDLPIVGGAAAYLKAIGK